MIESLQDTVLIGAGKLAHSLLYALKKIQLVPALIIDKYEENAKLLADAVEAPEYGTSLDLAGGKKYKRFFITVNDGSIKDVADHLAALDIDFPNASFVHFSGSLDSSELESLREKGSAVASLHFVQTFPTKQPVKLLGSTAIIESDHTALREEMMLTVSYLGTTPVLLDAKEKLINHLAAVFASNFVTSLASVSAALTHSIGRNPMLWHTLMRTTTENIINKGYENALSGPIDRRDCIIVEKHLRYLESMGDENLRQLYILHSLNLLELIRHREGALSDEHQKIAAYLEAELKRTP